MKLRIPFEQKSNIFPENFVLYRSNIIKIKRTHARTHTHTKFKKTTSALLDNSDESLEIWGLIFCPVIIK